GYQADEVRDSVKTAGIRFAEQHEQKGTGHALLCARGVIDTEKGLLLILNGDGPLLKPQTLRKLIGEQEQNDRAATIVTTVVPDPTGYGRILRDESGMVSAIVEQKAASPDQLTIQEINPGLYCFDAETFWAHVDEIRPNNAANEYYLTDMIEILRRHGLAVAPLLVADETELLGINTRIELAVANKLLRARKAEELMLSGVTIENPESVAIDMAVEVGPDTIIQANVQLRGRTRVGAECRIGAGSVIRDCDIADGVTILPYVVAEASTVGKKASIGPFARLRPDAHADESSHIGNFVELKKTYLGKGSKANHLAYLGDSEIGSGVNIGAGTITCNYDGAKKHPTKIGDQVFVGSNSTLVAPITIGDGAYIAAGSVITKQVEQDSLAIGRAYQVDKPSWARRRREQIKKSS
ncbi:MAG: bifunctional UDP-N-acetylglucosamine diphosphorylase/glucosamine-1-phosphate N-acetyltransferase GlmU, partial [Acidobacteriaceae bacterium]|nr:bifunctional UDP-N-acetylglucosamine diphosphorylase/glucosamine-1-phosphate N-acetyltransferase GlmU [Acidobacteriaceae bacterium]